MTKLDYILCWTYKGSKVPKQHQEHNLPILLFWQLFYVKYCCLLVILWSCNGKSEKRTFQNTYRYETLLHIALFLKRLDLGAAILKIADFLGKATYLRCLSYLGFLLDHIRYWNIPVGICPQIWNRHLPHPMD